MQLARNKIQFFNQRFGKQAKFMPIFLVFRDHTIYVALQMVQGLQLSARLSQSMVLAPQLQQSLALLQAPTLELKALVEQELQQNPVLEEIDERDKSPADESEAPATAGDLSRSSISSS